MQTESPKTGIVILALPVDMLRAADNAQLDPDTALKAGAVSEDEFLEAIQGAKVQLLVQGRDVLVGW